METITVNPERRDPGFIENKFDIGLGRVDNISSTDLIETIIKNAKLVANEKIIGDEIQTSGETFIPIFESAENSSTCSLEIGFYKEDIDSEVASFDVTINYNREDVSYLLNVSPNIDEIEDLYLRLCKKGGKLVGGIYWEDSSVYSSETNFKRIGINLINWTEGSSILDPSQNKISIYNINDISGDCSLLIDIPLNESSSTLDNPASSFTLYDSNGKKLIGTDSNYSSSQLSSMDVPTINGVPFLLKRGTLIDGVIDARHIEVPAKHENSHIDGAGAHNWDVLDKIRAAGLKEDSLGAVPGIGQIDNDDRLSYGVTRLSKYGKLDQTNITTESLNSWIKTLGIDTDVISVGLFKNFVGYIEKLIDSSYNPIVYDFSLADSSNSFLYQTSYGSDGVEILINTYKQVYSNSGYTLVGSFGTSQLLEYTLEDLSSIIPSDGISVEQVSDTQLKLTVAISRNNSQDSRTAKLILKQLDGAEETELPDLEINIFQEGFLIEYGYLYGDSMSSATPIFNPGIINLETDFEATSIIKYISPIISENTELGYRVLDDVRTEVILETKAKSWANVKLIDDNTLSIELSNNDRSSVRSASGYLTIYNEDNEILGKLPFTIKQGPVEGYLRITTGENYNIVKSGDNISITVSSNYPWTIDISTVPSWINISGFNGSMKPGIKTINLGVFLNNDDDREANIKFINDFGNTAIAKIYQSGKENFVDIIGFPDSDVYLSMASSGINCFGRDTVEITFKTDKTWLIDYKPDWITIDITSGTPDKSGNKIKLTYNSNLNPSKQSGDFVSIGYFDTNTNTIISLRKIYIDLRVWGTVDQDIYQDAGTGAYIFGATNHLLKQGESDYLYCIGDGRLKSNINDTESAIFRTFIINEDDDTDFTDSNWIYLQGSDLGEIGIKYPKIEQYNNKFRYYRKTVTAKETFDGYYYSSLTNVESVARNNSIISTEYYIDTIQNSIYHLGYPGSTFYPGTSNVAFEVSRNLFFRLMKFGLKVQAYNEQNIEIGNENGVTISGESNTITLVASKKDNNQPFVHLTLMNNSLPGWIYFETDLTQKTSIFGKDMFTEDERYIIHTLPNKTGESRSVTLQITDRGKKDTFINYTITQRSSNLSVDQKILIGAVPILSENINGPESSSSIEVKPLLTWRENFRIDGSNPITRTYREIPEVSSVEIYTEPIENDWLLIRKENLKYYLEIYQNTTSEIRKRTINVRASDEYGNTVTGSLDVYQPSSDGTMPRVIYNNLSASVIDLGLNSGENPVPIEISNIGYKIEGSRTIQYGENKIDEITNEELFPRYIGELVAYSTSKQKFNSDIPLSLVRISPFGSETQSSISISLGLYNIDSPLIIFQELNEISFEIEYSYLKISDQPVSINIIPINEEIVVEKGSINTGTDSDTFLNIPDPVIENQKYVIKKESTSLVNPGTTDRKYNETYGLSLQKSLAQGPIKFKGKNSNKTYYLTLVPEPIEPRLTISNPSDTRDEINTKNFTNALHGLEIPHYIYVEGINKGFQLGTSNFGSIIESCTGKNVETNSSIETVWKDSTTNFNTLSSSYFYAPHIPVSARVVGLEGFESISKSCGVHIKPNNDTDFLRYIFSHFRYSDNIDENIVYSGTQAKIYFNRLEDVEENKYVVNFGGLPIGVSISDVSIKNNISNQTFSFTRGRNNRRAASFNNSEITIYRFNIENDSEIHGTYPEPYNVDDEEGLMTCGDSISFFLDWGNSSGSNPGMILDESGDEFKIAEITFNFAQYSTDGLTFISQKTLEIWYKGKEIISELNLPAKVDGINRIIARGDRYIDGSGNMQRRLYLYDYGTTSESESYQLLFKTKKNWMIYEDTSKHSLDLANIDWSFNGVPYSSTFSNISQNCGYSGDTLTTLSPRIGMANSVFVEFPNKLSPWTYRGSEIYKEKIMSLFRIVATNNVTSSTDWGQLNGPEFRINIGPRMPRFSILDELSQQSSISHLGGDLKFLISSGPSTGRESGYLIRAKFSLDDYSYNYNDTLLIQTLFSGGLGFKDSDTPFVCWNGEQNDPVVIETQWARKLSYIPQNNEFYITIESRLKDTAEFDMDIIGYYDGIEGSGRGREFGTFTLTMKDPASSQMASNSPYTLTFNGICYDWNSDEWDENFNFDWDIDGEVILDSYYPTPSSEYYWELIQECYCDYDTSNDGIGGLPNSYNGDVFLLDTYESTLVSPDMLKVEYTGLDTRFWCLIGQPDGYGAYNYSPDNSVQIDLSEFPNMLRTTDDQKKLLVWLNNKSAGTNTLRVYKRTRHYPDRLVDIDFDM